MRYTIKDEPHLHGSVKALYLMNTHTYPPMSPETERAYALVREGFIAEMAAFHPKPDVIYNAALAASQNDVFGPGLLAAGFELVMTSVNPNTFRDIFLYVRNPGDV